MLVPEKKTMAQWFKNGREPVSLQRSVFRVALIALIATAAGVCSHFGKAVAQAQPESPKVDADGTMHISELTIPPSSLWSAEFAAFYAKYSGGSSQTKDMEIASKIPARRAPKAEWDKFDAVMDGQNADRLAWLLEHHRVNVEDTKIAGVRVAIISPETGVSPENARRVLINLHGGGFIANRGIVRGQLESIPIAALGKIKVITVDYRQGPFHEYPAASEDVEAVYRELLKKYKADAIGIYGCSAGGWITSEAVARFQKKALPRPGAVGLFCVAPPGRVGGDSLVWSFLPKSRLSEAERAAMAPCGWYMQSADKNDSEAYPALADDVLARFPPTLLLTGSRDLWLSSVLNVHVRFLRLGVDASLYVMTDAPHGAHVMAVGTPEAHDANAYIAKWFNQKLSD